MKDIYSILTDEDILEIIAKRLEITGYISNDEDVESRKYYGDNNILIKVEYIDHSNCFGPCFGHAKPDVVVEDINILKKIQLYDTLKSMIYKNKKD